MHVCDHRRHPIYTLQGPRLLVNRLVHCADPDCAAHHRTVSPEAEAAIALPRSIIGWDLFCWIGHRRFARHWSVPQIRAELLDSRQIELSDDHFLRDVAKPVLEQDRHAKVQMRSKIRGLRAIEREVSEERLPTADPAGVTPTGSDEHSAASLEPVPVAGTVVLDYCTAVKGILNDDQGGPLHPPGLRMAGALREVRQSLERNLQRKKGGALRTNCGVWQGASIGD
jgi:hypothetical protein